MIIHPHTSYFVPDFHGDDPDHTQGSQLYTQVGSPAVRLWLARCTAWVKQWSEAMDFLQTTPGPHLMRIHLVRYSTSVRYEKYSIIHLVRPIIHLVRIFALSTS